MRWLGRNHGSKALWAAGQVPDEPFVYTDPDIVPTELCPQNAVQHLANISKVFTGYPKIALGLYLEDVPESIPSLGWERELMSKRIAPGIYDSLADTSFALYPANAEYHQRAIRTGAPFLARHMGWYAELEPDDEDVYYLRHAMPGDVGSSWRKRVGVH